ncbi:hypothetical protein BTHI11S_02766 [Bosea thiooxidans]
MRRNRHFQTSAWRQHVHSRRRFRAECKSRSRRPPRSRSQCLGWRQSTKRTTVPGFAIPARSSASQFVSRTQPWEEAFPHPPRARASHVCRMSASTARSRFSRRPDRSGPARKHEPARVAALLEVLDRVVVVGGLPDDARDLIFALRRRGFIAADRRRIAGDHLALRAIGGHHAGPLVGLDQSDLGARPGATGSDDLERCAGRPKMPPRIEGAEQASSHPEAFGEHFRSAAIAKPPHPGLPGVVTRNSRRKDIARIGLRHRVGDDDVLACVATERAPGRGIDGIARAEIFPPPELGDGLAIVLAVHAIDLAGETPWRASKVCDLTMAALGLALAPSLAFCRGDEIGMPARLISSVVRAHAPPGPMRRSPITAIARTARCFETGLGICVLAAPPRENAKPATWMASFAFTFATR